MQAFGFNADLWGTAFRVLFLQGVVSAIFVAYNIGYIGI